MPEIQLSHSDTVPSATEFNKLLDALLALNGKTAGDGYEAYNLPTGVHFHKLPRKPVMGTITGGTNPYSWEYAAWGGPSAGWTTIGGGGSTSVGQAYEINSRTKVPSGYKTLLYPGYEGDWRFQWLRMGATTPGGGTVTCLPCGIPASSLTISWTNILTGNGSASMTFSDSPTNTWSTGCCDNGLEFELFCTGGTVELRAIYFTSGSCPTGTTSFCSNQHSSPAQLTLSAHTCSPFSMTFTCSSSGCPALFSAGNTQFVVTL
jgi:hypothetical protein